ncbi:MAG: outer membrane lipoprotein-sorting protein [Saprospiraceae bacterium]|nr:outer membrane lipoprotein-sorting protein [Saprospiraceae bacterium]
MQTNNLSDGSKLWISEIPSNYLHLFILLLCMAWLSPTAYAQSELEARDIIRKAEEKTRGSSSFSEMTMTIVRPTWTREVGMKSWTKDTDYSLILITNPARDKGMAFLKRKKEIWNWQPTIDRVIKMPPSMMMQSWMGSDFKNDDLVKESSILEDYTHQLIGTEKVEEYDCYKIELTPKEDAPVVWGKILSWISKDEFMQLKAEFYDEDGYLVNTMLGKNVKEMGGRTLPARLEVIPADEEGHKTIIEYQKLVFDQGIEAKFFSVQQMKRAR